MLIVFVGLLNFHVPHFLLEASTRLDVAAYALALGLSGLVLGALVAVAGIWQDARWGWQLGIVVAGTAIALYVAQETVGLPGLPRAWLEPSRLVALGLDLGFIGLACSRLGSRPALRAAG